MKQGEYKKGVWIPAKEIRNKDELLSELGKAYHKQWVLKREVLSLGHRIAEINEELAKP